MRHALSATFEPAAAVCGSLPGLVGDTPLVFIDTPFTEPGRGFWAKLEGHNPGGIKDRPALHMVTQARARGDLTPGAPIVESTSGTMGLGLALAGIAYGHPVTLVSDTGMEPMMRRLLRAYGAHLDVLSVADPVGGWQQARLDRVARHLHDNPGAWWPDQYRNPDNPAAYTGLAGELVRDLGRIDVLVCAVGTGGHSAGIAATLRRDNPGLRLIGVDATGSGIFGQPVRTRLMRGLGSSIHPANVDYAAFDEVHWVAPPEAVWAARALASIRYATGGWSTGAVALAAGWAARTEPPGTRIVAVFPDGPQRYTSTVFNDHYCRRHRLLASGPPAGPDTLAHPGDAEAVRWTRCTTITDPATWAVPA